MWICGVIDFEIWIPPLKLKRLHLWPLYDKIWPVKRLGILYFDACLKELTFNNQCFHSFSVTVQKLHSVVLLPNCHNKLILGFALSNSLTLAIEQIAQSIFDAKYLHSFVYHYNTNLPSILYWCLKLEALPCPAALEAVQKLNFRGGCKSHFFYFFWYFSLKLLNILSIRQANQ